LSEEFVQWEKIRGSRDAENYFYIYDLAPGVYVKLYNTKERIGSSTIMSNTPMEKRTNLEFVRAANGKVLIAGLGLAMIVLAVQDNENISSITIVEKCKDIIDLVKPQLPLNEKVKIVHADIFQFKPNKREKYDTIYFDIWSDIESAHYEDITKLHKMFRKYLNKSNSNKWMSSWLFKILQKEYYLEKSANDL
jgi:hypothetical protein